jgi:DNA-directed RNA polymerase specialized sigma24 family protein
MLPWSLARAPAETDLHRVWPDLEQLCRGAIAQVRNRGIGPSDLQPAEFEDTLRHLLGEVVLAIRAYAPKEDGRFGAWLFERLCWRCVDYWRSYHGRRGEKRVLPDDGSERDASGMAAAEPAFEGDSGGVGRLLFGGPFGYGDRDVLEEKRRLGVTAAQLRQARDALCAERLDGRGRGDSTGLLQVREDVSEGVRRSDEEGVANVPGLSKQVAA